DCARPSDFENDRIILLADAPLGREVIQVFRFERQSELGRVAEIAFTFRRLSARLEAAEVQFAASKRVVHGLGMESHLSLHCCRGTKIVKGTILESVIHCYRNLTLRRDVRGL